MLPKYEILTRVEGRNRVAPPPAGGTAIRGGLIGIVDDPFLCAALLAGYLVEINTKFTCPKPFLTITGIPPVRYATWLGL